MVKKKKNKTRNKIPKKVEKLKKEEEERKRRIEKKKIQKEKERKIVKKIQKEVKEVSHVDEKTIEYISNKIKDIKREIKKSIIGQEEIIDGLIRALLSNGHVLLEGVPGIAKTLAIISLGKATGCQAKRIQFTVDLLPTDITGITTYTPGKGFEIIKGPVFANFIIADEINRAPSKTQSALLEAMQEKQTTIGKKTFKLPEPFFVMATENPLETSGVYPLPEAQIDRFLFKILMTYPEKEEEKKVISENLTLKKIDDFGIKSVTSPSEIIKMQEITKKIFLSEEVKDYILNIVTPTRNGKFKNSEFIEWGASPRAGIALFIASKAEALMRGRNYVTPEDVKNIAHDVLRHRIILNYEAQAQKISSDDVITSLLNSIEFI